MSQWTVRTKIIAGFAAILLLSFSIAGYYTLVMRPAASAMTQLAQSRLPEIDLAVACEREILNARIHFIYHVTIQKPGALELGWQRYRNARALMAKLQDRASSDPGLAEFRAPTQELQSSFDRYEPVLARILDVVDKRQNSGPEFTRLIADWAAAGAAVVNAAGELSRRCSEASARSAHEQASNLTRAVTWIFPAAFLGILAAIAIAWLVNRDIARRMVRVVSELTKVADRISGTAGCITSANHAVSKAANNLAASLHETSSSPGQISSAAEKNSEQSRTAAALVTQSQEKFSAANTLLDSTVAAMNEVSRQSEDISKIIKVIDEIAFQTNILSLNAAVEAARAGESGMGFAVVAEEVRSLAQRSAQAAKDTAALIEASISRSREGKARVDDVNLAIHAITGDIGRVKTLIDDVNRASQEQTFGIRQLAGALSQMDHVNHSATASAAESESAAAEFKQQSAILHDAVAELTALL